MTSDPSGSAAALVLAASVTPVLCIGFAVLGGTILKRRRRQRHDRLPIDSGHRSRRLPGARLRGRIVSVQIDLIACLVGLALSGTLVLVGAVGPILFGGAPSSITHLVPLFILTVAVAAALVRRLIYLCDELEDLELGHECELVVGQALETLVPRGVRVRHDVPLRYESGRSANADHVVIAAQGLFLVETKGRRRAPAAGRTGAGGGAGGADRSTIEVDARGLRFARADGSLGAPVTDAVRQARGQARELRQALTRELGRPAPWVQVLLVYPGWRIRRTADPDGVRVVSAGELGDVIGNSAGRTPDSALDAVPGLSVAERQALVSALDRVDGGVARSALTAPVEDAAGSGRRRRGRARGRPWRLRSSIRARRRPRDRSAHRRGALNRVARAVRGLSNRRRAGGGARPGSPR